MSRESADYPIRTFEQPSVGIFVKRYYENMQQIYRRTPMPKCNFNKFANVFLGTPLEGCF